MDFSQSVHHLWKQYRRHGKAGGAEEAAAAADAAGGGKPERAQGGRGGRGGPPGRLELKPGAGGLYAGPAGEAAPLAVRGNPWAEKQVAEAGSGFVKTLGGHWWPNIGPNDRGGRGGPPGRLELKPGAGGLYAGPAGEAAPPLAANSAPGCFLRFLRVQGGLYAGPAGEAAACCCSWCPRRTQAGFRGWIRP